MDNTSYNSNMVPRQSTTEITPIYSPISTSEEMLFSQSPIPSTSQTRAPIPFPQSPIPSTSQTRAPIPFQHKFFLFQIYKEFCSKEVNPQQVKRRHQYRFCISFLTYAVPNLRSISIIKYFLYLGSLFHHDIINEALSSSGISETSISLGYHLGKRARNSRHSTKSHSSSSGDSRRRLVKHKSRHSRCSNREVEAKDEMELPQGVELFKYGILKRFMDKYIKHGSKVGIKLDADILRFTCKLFSDIMIYHIK
ncbi:hypothetical protein TNCV_4050622 [Trichonephila clavipes]|nr:hypothetical protein TNCV_4050622 [Trichonephila clavipes]